MAEEKDLRGSKSFETDPVIRIQLSKLSTLRKEEKIKKKTGTLSFLEKGKKGCATEKYNEASIRNKNVKRVWKIPSTPARNTKNRSSRKKKIYIYIATPRRHEGRNFAWERDLGGARCRATSVSNVKRRWKTIATFPATRAGGRRKVKRGALDRSSRRTYLFLSKTWTLSTYR